MQLHAGVTVQRLNELGALGRDAPAHRARQRLQHRYLGAALASRRGDFQPDHAGADAHDAPRRGEPSADQPCILDGAQIERLLATRDRKMSGPATHCEQQPIVVEAPPVRQPETMGGRIQFGHCGAQQQFDPLLLVAFGGVEICDRRFGFVGQHGLGQRRTLIGPPRLVANQHDAAVIAGLTHGDGGPAASLAGADDYVCHRPRRRLVRQPGVGPASHVAGRTQLYLRSAEPLSAEDLYPVGSGMIRQSAARVSPPLTRAVMLAA